MEEQATTNQLDIGYTKPPPYPAPTHNPPVLESVVQTEEPPSYHASSQDIDTQQTGGKTAQQQVQLSRIVYSQPRSEPLVQDHLQRQVVEASADRMYAISIGWCIVCCLCGSPLTLACFIPAIIMSTKVIMGSYITH